MTTARIIPLIAIFLIAGEAMQFASALTKASLTDGVSALCHVVAFYFLWQFGTRLVSEQADEDQAQQQQH